MNELIIPMSINIKILHYHYIIITSSLFNDFLIFILKPSNL